MVANSEGFFQHGTTRRKLFYRLWEPLQCHALVIIIHGFGEHSGRYAALAQALAQHGLGVACPDLWGHGRSDGRRGDIGSFAQYLEDLDALTSQVFLARFSQRPVAVFGHSFGGLVAIHWALRSPDLLRCLILQSPLLEVGFPVPKWKERLIGFLGRLWQGFPLPIGLDPVWLSHDATVVQQYRQDPLVHSRISARGHRALQGAMRQALDQAKDVSLPTLLLYGGADRVVSVKACQAFFERLACEKRAVDFPDCYHELHHEAVQPRVVELVSEWVQAHG